MTQTHPFSQTLEALAELAPEIRTSRVDPGPALPSLAEVLAEFSPFPRDATFLGLAADGLPVLLDLRNPLPGPLLIVGDARCGKTRLLQTIARAVDGIHQAQDVKYAVLTDRPDEWTSFETSPNCEEIVPLRAPRAAQFLSSVSDWAHVNKGGRQSILLLIDDLQACLSRPEVHEDFQWLLLRGPSRLAWPITTLDAGGALPIRPWLAAFRTRLFGFMENDAQARELANLEDASFSQLIPGAQFAMREGNTWLPFWIPRLD